MRLIKRTLFLLLALTAPLQAVYYGYDRYSCQYWPTHVDFDGLFFGNRQTGDLTLFWPLFQAQCFTGFFQGTIGRFDDQWHGNVGVGCRTQLSRDMAWGANIFCDYSYSDRTRLNWLQGGVGVELLGQGWEVRANGYLPDLDRRRVSFNQNSIIVLDPDSPEVMITTTTNIVDQQARWGFDAEVGAGLCLGPGSLWGYAGYFYFTGRELEARQGPRLRLEYKLPILFCWGEAELWAGGEWQYDDRHRSQGRLYIHVQVPLYGWRSGLRCPNICVHKRMGNSVRRQNGLLLERIRERTVVPRTLQLFFIREGEANANPGTQTNPTTLFTANADSVAGDFIFPLNRLPNPPGTPIPIDTELGTAYALKPDQTLISFGDSTSVTLDFGDGATLVVQDLDGAGRGAFSQSAALNAIEISDGNLIQGIEIRGGAQ